MCKRKKTHARDVPSDQGKRMQTHDEEIAGQQRMERESEELLVSLTRASDEDSQR